MFLYQTLYQAKLFLLWPKLKANMLFEFNPIPPREKIFNSDLNNGVMTLIFSDVSRGLSIEYLTEKNFKNLTQNLHR